MAIALTAYRTFRPVHETIGQPPGRWLQHRKTRLQRELALTLFHLVSQPVRLIDDTGHANHDCYGRGRIPLPAPCRCFDPVQRATFSFIALSETPSGSCPVGAWSFTRREPRHSHAKSKRRWAARPWLGLCVSLLRIFFELAGRRVHEVGFYYEAELAKPPLPFHRD